MTIPMSMPEKGLGIDVLRIVERFKHGRIGKHFDQVVMTYEVQNYFKGQLIDWTEAESNEMTPFASNEFHNLTTPSVLWQNFLANFAINAFVNSMRKWLNTDDEDFDALIIEFVTVENAKRVIDALQTAIKGVATEVQARNIDESCCPNITPFGMPGKKKQEYFS